MRRCPEGADAVCDFGTKSHHRRAISVTLPTPHQSASPQTEALIGCTTDRQTAIYRYSPSLTAPFIDISLQKGYNHEKTCGKVTDMSRKKKQKNTALSPRQKVTNVYLMLMFGVFPVFCTD